MHQANNYTDSQISQLRTEANAGIASAMAMGLSGRSANGAWMYRAASSSTTKGDIGAAVGVGYEW